MSNNNNNQLSEYITKQCDKAKSTAQNLLHAPLACSLIQTLAVLSNCTKDPSLKSEDQNQTFEHLKNPDSFRASLYEVINAMCRAFRTSHNSMDRIHLSLEMIPDLMNDCFDALNRPKDDDAQDIIDYAISFINDAAETCKDAAQEAHQDNEKALYIIEELSAAVKATQGRKERRTVEAQIEYEDQLRQQKKTEEAIREYKRLIKEQKQVIEDARDDYKIRMAQSTDFTGVFGAMFVDNFEKIVSTAGNMVSSIGCPSGAVMKAAPGVINTVAGLLKNYADFKKESLLDKVMDTTIFDVLTKIINEPYEEVVANIDIHLSTLKGTKMYETKSDIGKLLQKSAAKIRESLKSVKKGDPLGKEEFEKAKGEASVHLKNYETMMGFVKLDEEKFQQLSSEERQTVMKIRLDNLKVARETLAAERELQEKLRQEKDNAIEKYGEIITNIARLEIEDVDLKDILIYLQEGVEQLTQVQTAWENIVAFFAHIKNIVDGSLYQNIKGMTMIAKTAQQKKYISDRQTEMLLKNVTNACAVSYVLMESAQLYKQVSSTYVKPIIDSSICNMALTREQAQNKKREITSDYDALKAAVNETIAEHKQQLSKTVYAKMQEQGFFSPLAIENEQQEGLPTLNLAAEIEQLELL